MHFAIIQPWGLGDLVMTTPVIAEFRRLYPDAKLTLIVQGKAQAGLMRDSPLVDQILNLPPASDSRALFAFFTGLRREKIDVAFLATRITGLFPWVFKYLSGIPEIVGDSVKYPHLYSVTNVVDPSVHRVDRMLETFARWSGQPPAMPPLFPLPIDGDALKGANATLAKFDLHPGRFLVFHPGSSVVGGTEKRVPADLARRVVDEIQARRPDLDIAFIFGPDEIDYMDSFTGLGSRQLVISGLPLTATIALIAQAAGFIGTDSSLGHFAAAFNVPTVTLFGPTIATETIPYGPNARGISRVERLECQPCWGTPLYGQCPIAIRCMRELPESEIAAIATAW